MANVLVNESSLEDIADAIRSKNGTSTKYKPAEMADAISAISGGGITPTGTKTISITQNGTVTEDVTQYASAQVNANVPNSYSASDEGKVVDSGALVAQTSKSISANGTYDTTTNDEVVVSVPQGITPTGTKNISITSNGTTTEDVTNYASAQIAVNVPNSYSASDEGKVVDDGALVAQTSQSITANGTYDTTLKNEVVVNVSGGGGITTKFTGTVELSGVSTTSISIPISGYTLTGDEKIYATLKLVGTGAYSGGAVTWDDEIQVPSDISNSNRLIVSGLYSNRRRGISTINNSSGTAVSGGKTAANSVYAVNTAAAGGAVSTNNNSISINTENNAIVLSSNTGYKYCNTTWGTKYEYEVYLLTSSGTLA